MKERNYSLDLLRIFLCLCVIALHSYTNFGIEDYTVEMCLMVFLSATNGLFYLLSGYFNLEKDINSASDIKRYYKSKFINVLFPFLVFNLFWVIWDYLHVNGNTVEVTDIINAYFVQLVEKGSEGHMWFMYPLFGMLLSAPFLSKMLHHMDNKELKMLWRIAIGFNVILYFVCVNYEHDFNVSAWFMAEWMIYFIGGYYYRHVASNESKVKWIIIGIGSFIFTVIGVLGGLKFFKQFTYSCDLQPMFTLFCVGYLFMWDKGIKIKNNVVKKVIVFLSKNTYLIYLFHMRGIEFAMRKLPALNPNFGYGMLVIIASLAVSLIAAYIFDLVLKPVQKLMNDKIIVK